MSMRDAVPAREEISFLQPSPHTCRAVGMEKSYDVFEH